VGSGAIRKVKKKKNTETSSKSGNQKEASLTFKQGAANDR